MPTVGKQNSGEADLRGASLRNADFRESNLEDADLREADLEGTQLRGCIYNANTKWPTGFDAQAVGAVVASESED
jgi:uncharacterized protein YjbI with pentapeptide repeats